MEVLERYLQAVRFWLPKAQQDDIVSELSVDLRAQIEDAEAERGRRLDEAELESLLQRRGHPLWVAEPYLPQQHLIGPALLPAYRRVLRIALGCQLAGYAAVYLLLGLVFRVRGVSADPGAWLWQASLYAFATGGLITLVFARLDRSQQRARALGVWDPRRPAELPSVPPDPEAERLHRRRVSAAGELVGSALFALFWLGLVRLPDTPGASFGPTAIWRGFYWPILVLCLAEVALAAVTIVRPRHGRKHYGLALARDSFALVLLGRLLAGGPWMVAIVPDAPAEKLAVLASMVNASVAITLAAIAAFYVAAAVRDARGALGKEPARHWSVRFLAGE
ncbi:MAG TPA: hypothetical protein VF310_11475 [Vicinamibacteria bacterium]